MVDYLYRAVFIKIKLSIYILAKTLHCKYIFKNNWGGKNNKTLCSEVDIVRYYFPVILAQRFLQLCFALFYYCAPCSEAT